MEGPRPMGTRQTCAAPIGIGGKIKTQTAGSKRKSKSYDVLSERPRRGGVARKLEKGGRGEAVCHDGREKTNVNQRTKREEIRVRGKRDKNIFTRATERWGECLGHVTEGKC